jgi:hypothetical protein
LNTDVAFTVLHVRFFTVSITVCSLAAIQICKKYLLFFTVFTKVIKVTDDKGNARRGICPRLGSCLWVYGR